jgi:hypothetical protein
VLGLGADQPGTQFVEDGKIWEMVAMTPTITPTRTEMRA